MFDILILIVQRVWIQQSTHPTRQWVFLPFSVSFFIKFFYIKFSILSNSNYVPVLVLIKSEPAIMQTSEAWNRDDIWKLHLKHLNKFRGDCRTKAWRRPGTETTFENYIWNILINLGGIAGLKLEGGLEQRWHLKITFETS